MFSNYSLAIGKVRALKLNNILRLKYTYTMDLYDRVERAKLKAKNKTHEEVKRFLELNESRDVAA